MCGCFLFQLTEIAWLETRWGLQSLPKLTRRWSTTGEQFSRSRCFAAYGYWRLIIVNDGHWWLSIGNNSQPLETMYGCLMVDNGWYEWWIMDMSLWNNSHKTAPTKPPVDQPLCHPGSSNGGCTAGLLVNVIIEAQPCHWQSFLTHPDCFPRIATGSFNDG